MIEIESSKQSDEKSQFKAVIKNTPVDLCKEYQNELEELGVINIEQLKSIKKNVQLSHTVLTFDSIDNCLSLIQDGVIIQYYRRHCPIQQTSQSNSLP
jgi:hypothetical protein